MPRLLFLFGLLLLLLLLLLLFLLFLLLLPTLTFACSLRLGASLPSLPLLAAATIYGNLSGSWGVALTPHWTWCTILQVESWLLR